MTPQGLIDHTPDYGARHAVSFRKGILAFPVRETLSYLAYLFRAQLGCVVTTFSHGITHVVEMRAQEKVVRSNACGSVASVTDLQAFRDCTVMQFPRVAGCETYTGFRVRKSALSRGVSAADPQPASVGLLNLQPKPLFDRRRIQTMPRKAAIATTELSLTRQLSLEHPRALLAGQSLGSFGSHRTVLSSGATGLGLLAQSRGLSFLANS